MAGRRGEFDVTIKAPTGQNFVGFSTKKIDIVAPLLSKFKSARLTLLRPVVYTWAVYWRTHCAATLFEETNQVKFDPSALLAH